MPSPAGDHYFSSEPTSSTRRQSVSLSLPSGPVELETDRGVFSPRRIDLGTSVLLRAVSEHTVAGPALDLGCGYGPLAVAMATASPAARVYAVDVNERARQLCAANAAALGLTNIEVHGPDDVAGDVRYATIWSNPPIRIGKSALHDVLDHWLGRLSDDGQAVLVVQRHLGADSLQQWLTDAGRRVDRLASKKGYRVLRVSA